MLSFPNSLKVVLATAALNMCALGRYSQIKIMYFDGTGLGAKTKCLEQGTFTWPPGATIIQFFMSVSFPCLQQSCRSACL